MLVSAPVQPALRGLDGVWVLFLPAPSGERLADHSAPVSAAGFVYVEYCVEVYPGPDLPAV